MKKLLSISLLFFLSALYIISTSDRLMRDIAPARYTGTGFFAADKYRFGDLYGLSYLKQFKIPDTGGQKICNDTSQIKNINLYMLCDSYLWGFLKSDSAFCGVNKLSFAKWRLSQIGGEIDQNKRNILIIEIAERSFRKYLADTSEVFSSVALYNKGQVENIEKKKNSVWDKLSALLFKDHSYSNSVINSNLEFNLFDYAFLSSIKELKASFNYSLFNRTDADVSVSSNGKFLFYNETIDTSMPSGSFSTFRDEELENLVNNINQLYDHYKKLGFEEVYLSIIPNPVTILDPEYGGKHNGLIPRVYSNRKLKTPLIDVYTIFKNSPSQVYRQSDTHWSQEGFSTWVNEANRILREKTAK